LFIHFSSFIASYNTPTHSGAWRVPPISSHFAESDFFFALQLGQISLLPLVLHPSNLALPLIIFSVFVHRSSTPKLSIQLGDVWKSQTINFSITKDTLPPFYSQLPQNES